MFTPFQKILPFALNKMGMAREARAALVCEKYRQLAPTAVHKEALIHTVPKFFRTKVLTIGVANPAWAAHVASRKNELMAALNNALGENYVTEIKTRVLGDITESQLSSD
jgi:predicted nucleic acid-binding Zn ribbon protein